MSLPVPIYLALFSRFLYISIFVEILNNMGTNCFNCKKEITYKDCFRCRICKDYFCDKCSLDHFGLSETEEHVKHRSIFKTLWWMIKRNFK
jgi:hypothetical protein